MTRTRVLIAACAAIAMVAAMTTTSSAAVNELYATMTGKQEKPAAGDPDGTATAELTFKSGKICYDIRPKKAGITFAAGHIHAGAAGVAGDVAVPLFQKPKKVTGGKLTGCSPKVAAALAAKIKAKPANYYVNVHNAKYPGGALRGQLSKIKTS